MFKKIKALKREILPKKVGKNQAFCFSLKSQRF